MLKLTLVVLNFLPFFVFATNSSQIGYIEKPEFSYLERYVLEVKYKSYQNTTGEGHLFVCRTCNKNASFVVRLQCANHKNCPDYGEVQHCQSRGHYKICQIRVSKDVFFRGYVSRRDSKNVTKRSKVASYLTSEKTKAPRPVTNFTIKPENTDLVLKWTPSNIYSRSTQYHQWVFCQPTQDKNAKAFRKMLLGFDHSTLVVHSFNISAATKYRCCIEVENAIHSMMSKRKCKHVTSPEQAPSAAPVIECGNSTGFECPSEVKGVYRNVTILFKAPVVKERNGHITHHVVMYRSDGSSNSTTVLTFNGSATTAKLVGLKTDTRYLVSIMSCNTAGCSPSSNTVEILEIKHRISDGSSMTKVIVIAVMMIVAVALVVLVCFCIMRRNKIMAERIPLPELNVPTRGMYYNPTNPALYPLYNYVRDNNYVRNPAEQMPAEQTPAEQTPTVNCEVNDGQNTTDDERGKQVSCRINHEA